MKSTDLEYDVVIMGAGFAGICQARHLLLNIPNIRVALVDPRPEERTDKDLKIGESMIEAAALFVSKELGLYDYLVEKHAPKAGLNFHWPKDPATTDTIDDYYHIWVNRQLPIASIHVNRATFERDVLQMNKEMGATFYNGRVVDVDLTPSNVPHTVKVRLDGQTLELKAKHVVDAAGFAYIINRKTDNLVSEPEKLFGVKNGSAWVRVRNIDRTIFHNGYDPHCATTGHYYATNHWFGYGHWLWMIPTSKDPLELSIGVIHHHEIIPGEQLNSLDKFYAFLEANHTILYKLIASGETVDFHYWPRIAHTSKKVFSEDNWYVIGDAAYIFDAFYSYGTTMTTFAMESVTEVVRAKLAGEADAEEKRVAYNEFNLSYARIVNHLMKQHPKQLGNASIMSWRIYFEYMFWFGFHIPMYVGKWHLSPRFVRAFVKAYRSSADEMFDDVYNQFDELVERGANIGLMDCYRADQLLWGYSAVQHADHFLENAKLEPRRSNVFGCMKSTFFYVALWYLKFQWTGFGLAGVLAPKHIKFFLQLLQLSATLTLVELFYRFETRHLPSNSQVEQMRQDFKNYRYQAKLRPWSA